MRRIFLIIILVLAVLIVVIAGAAWFLLGNESFLKSQLSDIVLKQTGRELTVSGPLTLDIGRETSIEAGGISFQNADWAEHAEMVRIGRLQVTIDVTSLWDETIIIPSLALEECSIELLKNDAGEANWDVLPESEPSSEPPPPRTALPVHLLDTRVRNCQLIVDGPQRKRPLSLALETLELRIKDNIHVSLEGAGSLNEDPLSLSGWYEPLGAFFLGGPVQHELKITQGEISLQSSGTLEDAAHFTGADITAHFSGPDIASILEHAGLQPVSEGGFDFRLDLNSVEQMTRLEVNGDLGSIHARAEGQLDRLRKPSQGSINTSLEGENLQLIGHAFGIEGLVAESFNLNTEASFEKDIVLIKAAKLSTAADQLDVEGHIGTSEGLANTALQFNLISDEIGRWAPALGQPDMTVGALTVDGKLNSNADGLFSIEGKMLHGVSVLEITGDIGQLPGPVSPDLNVNFKSENPRTLAALLGRPDFPAVPLTINGSVAKTEKQIRLTEVNLDLASNRVRIDGAVNLTDNRSGSSLKLDVDVPNAAELGLLFGIGNLPPQPLQVKGLVEPRGKGLSIKINDDDSSDISLDLDALIVDLRNPDRVDATFDIRLPSLKMVQFLMPDMPLPNEPVTASGHLSNAQDRLDLEGIELKLADHRAHINGHVNRADKYAGSELDVLLDVASLARLGQLFGDDGLPDERMKLHSNLRPHGKGLAFTLKDGNLGKVQMEIEGKMEDLENPLAVNVRFDIQLPSIRLLDFLVPDHALPDLPFSASGQLLNEHTRTRFSDVRLAFGQMSASVDGDIGQDESLNLAIQAQIPDVSRLAEVTGMQLPAEPFSVKTKLGGTFTELEFADLSSKLGRGEVHGHLNIGLGDVKKISGRLDSSYLDFSWWVPEEEPAEAEPAAKQSEWVFDETPVRDPADLGIEANLDLALAKVDLGNTIIQDVELGLLLDSKRLELNPISMRGMTGDSVTGKALWDRRGAKPELTFKLHAKELRLGLFAVEGQDAATYPPIDIDVEISGSGETRREVASELNGKVRLFQGSGQIASAGVSFLLSDFITELFSLLNPFAETSEYTNLDCAIFAADIVSGQVEVSPVIINTEQLTILSTGKIDLDTENIDLSFNTKVRQGLGLSAGMIINPLIKVGGRMVSPAIELDPAGAVVKGGLAVATVGLSLVAKSMSDRFLSSKDPCGDAKKEIAKRDSQ